MSITPFGVFRHLMAHGWKRAWAGVKDYRVVFVFKSEKALAQFLDSRLVGFGANGCGDQGR
jgi:hypothetical protein